MSLTEPSCHRCATHLSRQDTFCPVCGAPQLSFDAGTQDAADASLPNYDRPGQVIWRDAVGAAVLIAIPAGILCGLPFLSGLSLLWVMGGASLVIRLYKKKRPLALLNGRSGFRIGIVFGLAAAYISAAATSILAVVQRYPLHEGGEMDRLYESSMTQSAALFAGLMSSPQMQASLRESVQFWLTTDGRAALALIAMSYATVATTLLASLGGYLGVRLFAGRRLA